MGNELKAIETVYNGYKFRSRLEARWAVFFDKAGIEYQYEPEGFDLGDGVWYLPDFYLPQYDVYVEVKPCNKARFSELEKCEKLVERDPKKRIVILGDIPYREGENLWWAPCMYWNPLHQVAYVSPVCLIDGVGGDMLQYFKVARDRNIETTFLRLDIDDGKETIWTAGECKGFLNDWDIHSEGREFCFWESMSYDDQDQLNEAYKAARFARFEHGENG